MRGSRLYLCVGCVGVLWSGWVACSDSPGTGPSADAAVQQDSAPSDSGTVPDGAPVDSATPPDGAPEDGGLPGADAAVDSGAVDGGATPDGGLPGTGCITGSFSPYYGNFHAHTSNSDGEGTPAEAFDMARNQGLLDIQVVTDHLEQLYELWGADSGEYDDCRTAADAANVPGTFLALCGYEYGSGFGTVGSTGHNNVFLNDDLFPMVQLDFLDFYQSVIGCTTCVTQFNHPGDDSGQTWSDWVYDAGVDAKMNLFELNGGGATWDLLFDALDAGWHVSPMHNQDNHSANWGTANDRRSGFYLSALTRPALSDAMRERRSFATTDKNATLRLMGDTTCWMGSILSGYASLGVEVQATDTDAGDGFVTVELYGPGQTLLHTAPCSGQTTCALSYSLSVTGPTYALARATQTDGDVLVSAPIWVSP